MIARPTRGAGTKVLQTRTGRGGTARRRRQCPRCGARVSSLEVFTKAAQVGHAGRRGDAAAEAGGPARGGGPPLSHHPGAA